MIGNRDANGGMDPGRLCIPLCNCGLGLAALLAATTQGESALIAGDCACSVGPADWVSLSIAVFAGTSGLAACSALLNTLLAGRTVLHGPNRDLQESLAGFDSSICRVLLPRGANKALSKWSARFLEVGYLAVYPLVPVGLAVLYIADMRWHADHYWTVVLVTTYTCYAVTPFVPALPPRLLAPQARPAVPATAPRRLNNWIIRNASIRAITFPSAHVASAAAAALVLVALISVAGLIFACVTIAIGIACVLGGYHYTADVLAGALIAVLVFVGLYCTAMWTERKTESYSRFGRFSVG
jgi:membrane-associated phospholipid phosphatase